jgi:hypothetical protein
MPQFLDLPRELRDLIYTDYLTGKDPQPSAKSTRSTHGWDPLWATETGSSGASACFFAAKETPTTCANLLTTNRQVNAEMRHAIERAKRKGGLVARVDCMVKNERRHYFTWLSLPLIHKATPAPGEVPSKEKCSWAPRVLDVARLLAAPKRSGSSVGVTTHIEALQIDVRMFRDEPGRQANSRSESTGWAVCAALTRICGAEGERDVCIDTLVLNVVAPTAKETLGTQRDSAQSDAARVVARQLVDLWNKLWSSERPEAQRYRGLLGRIKRVRICVDEVLVSERGLRLELERGQAETRKIAFRGGRW